MLRHAARYEARHASRARHVTGRGGTSWTGRSGHRPTRRPGPQTQGRVPLSLRVYLVMCVHGFCLFARASCPRPRWSNKLGVGEDLDRSCCGEVLVVALFPLSRGGRVVGGCGWPLSGWRRGMEVMMRMASARLVPPRGVRRAAARAPRPRRCVAPRLARALMLRGTPRAWPPHTRVTRQPPIGCAEPWPRCAATPLHLPRANGWSARRLASRGGGGAERADLHAPKTADRPRGGQRGPSRGAVDGQCGAWSFAEAVPLPRRASQLPRRPRRARELWGEARRAAGGARSPPPPVHSQRGWRLGRVWCSRDHQGGAPPCPPPPQISLLTRKGSSVPPGWRCSAATPRCDHATPAATESAPRAARGGHGRFASHRRAPRSGWVRLFFKPPPPDPPSSSYPRLGPTPLAPPRSASLLLPLTRQ